MAKRVRAPRRPADGVGARITKRADAPTLERKGNGPGIGSTNLGDGLTVGRPALQSRQSRFESGSPNYPDKRGRRFGPLSIDRRVHIARTGWTFQNPAHGQSRIIVDWPHEHYPI